MHSIFTLLWMIDKDHVGGTRINYGQRLNDARNTSQSFDNVVGRTVFMDNRCDVTEIPRNKKIRWKAYDDDGELYYEGHIRYEALFDKSDDSDTDYAYNVCRFVEADAGATVVYWNAEDIAQHEPNFVAKHPKSDKEGWIQIYG